MLDPPPWRRIPWPQLGHGQLSWRLMLEPLSNGKLALGIVTYFLTKTWGMQTTTTPYRLKPVTKGPGSDSEAAHRDAAESPASCWKQAGSWSR